MQAELGRKEFLHDKKEKHLKRLFKHNSSLREAAEEVVTVITKKYQNIVDDIEANDALGTLSKVIKNYGAGAATSAEDE